MQHMKHSHFNYYAARKKKNQKRQSGKLQSLDAVSHMTQFCLDKNKEKTIAKGVFFLKKKQSQVKSGFAN